MSTLQVANVHLETTGNNRIQYAGSNSYTMYAGGIGTLAVNTTAIGITGDSVIIGNASATNITASANVNAVNITASGSITQNNVTSGAGVVIGEQMFRLAADGSAIGLSLADFFGATSAISLEASSVYEVTAYLVFLKTTAGSVGFSMVASSAPTRMFGTYMGTAVGGIGTGTGPVTGFGGSQGSVQATLTGTQSLTTAVNHVYVLTMQIQTNAATNFRLQINNSAGNLTPLAGSYYRVKKISASTGTFVA